MKTNYFALHTPQIEQIYKSANNGSLFVYLLQNQLSNSYHIQYKFSEIEKLWSLFDDYKNKVISSAEYLNTQNNLSDWDVLNSFKYSQTAYIYYVESRKDEAIALLNKSMETDYRLMTTGNFSVMTAHYIQSILNHNRLENDGSSHSLEKILFITNDYLELSQNISKLNILIDVLGVQALNKIQGPRLAEFVEKTKTFNTQSESNFCTPTALQLSSAILKQDSILITKLLNKAKKMVAYNPLLSVFLSKLLNVEK